MSSLLFLTLRSSSIFFFFFFNDTATTEIYTLSLHDALPIFLITDCFIRTDDDCVAFKGLDLSTPNNNVERITVERSEEHTSELQSHSDLVCRLLLEKKKKKTCCITRCYYLNYTSHSGTACSV